MYRIWQEWQSW